MQDPVEVKKARWPWFLFLAVLVGAGVWALFYFGLLNQNGAYQAVFLDNGQVYFGKLSRTGSQYHLLEDVYYIQIDPGNQDPDSEEAAGSNVNLVKRGEELHGPQNSMRINRDKILFIEDLRDDSAIIQNIQKLKDIKK